MRIDPQTGRHTPSLRFMLGVVCLNQRTEFLILRHAVEGYVRASLQKLREGLLRIYRAIRMHILSEEIKRQLHLIERRSRGGGEIFRNYRECLPQGVGLERHDYLDSGTLLGLFQAAHIAPDAAFIYYVIGCLGCVV